jgi:NADH-quinone oxidoreductase subunit K
MIEGIGINDFLVVSTIMFFVGVYGFLVRKNLITMLMSVELILNAANINFVVFNKYLFPDMMQGYMFSLFVIGIAAAEAAVAIAIILNVYRNLKDINVEHLDTMKH